MQATDFSSIDDLLAELDNNLNHARLSLQRQEQILSRIKIASRQKHDAGPLFKKESISVLSKYAFSESHGSAAQEALRCLANTLFWDVPSRQFFVDLGHGTSAAERLRDCGQDKEFLCARLLFLLTYNTSLDFQMLVQRHGLARSITFHLKEHAKAIEHLGEVTDPSSMAMSEMLRLLFNIQHFFPDLKKDFLDTLQPIASILLTTTWPDPPLQAPLASVINALLSLDLKTAGERHDADNTKYTQVVERLINIFDRSVRNYAEKELEQSAAPLCTLLRRTYELSNASTRSRMQELMLPLDTDRQKPLGKGDSFSARLLQLSTSPLLPTLRENISNLLYELNDRDAERFVRSVGYGYASGFLMSHNIAVPVDTVEDDTVRSADIEPVNPITGQKLSAEDDKDNVDDGMTEEEKEREAERLFVLFERLKATGVVDVKNPVEEYRDRQ